MTQEQVDNETDPAIVALAAFADSADALQSAWMDIGSDGNHPITTSDAYPFGGEDGEMFGEVAKWIRHWYEQSLERAKAATK